MRFQLILLPLLVAPVTASAQWTVGIEAGVHADRLRPPQRVLADGSSTFMMSAPGEAPAIGVRAVYWRNHFGFDAGVVTSQNRSWSGGGSVPLPDFSKRTTFTNAGLLWRPLDPAARAQVHMGVGAAAIFHGGSGESVLTRTTDLGGVATAGAALRIGERFTLGLSAYNYRFSSEFRDVDYEGPMDTFQSGSRSRSEWLVLPTLRIQF